MFRNNDGDGNDDDDPLSLTNQRPSLTPKEGEESTPTLVRFYTRIYSITLKLWRVTTSLHVQRKLAVA